MNQPNSSPRVSILVPIYNATTYLRQCLDSLVQQTLTDIEIICINDGSTDDSLQIIQEYMEQDSRIIIIDKPNSGYGDSMNKGIKQAHGEYIGIVEPDDYVELKTFEKLYDLAKEHNVDVVRADFYLQTAKKATKSNRIPSELANKLLLHHSSPVATEPYSKIFTLPPAIWSAIYRRRFLLDNEIEFLATPGASYQDIGFSFKVWALAERVFLTTSAYYHYRLDNEQSSSNSMGKVKCVVTEYADIERFLKSHKLYSELSGPMLAAKFGNYYWNWRRLKGNAAQEFYQTLYQEFTTANQSRLLHQTDFQPRRWHALQLILKHPKLASKILH